METHEAPDTSVPTSSGGALVVSLSHGEAGNRPRPARAADFGATLLAAGLEVDQLVWLERSLTVAEEAQLGALRRSATRLVVVRSDSGGLLRRLWRRCLSRHHAGLGRGVPRALREQARRLVTARRPQTVILGSPRLLDLAHELAADAVWLDLTRLPEDVLVSRRRLGREDAGDALPALSPTDPRLEALAGVTLSCEADARRWAACGYEGRILVAPPLCMPSSAAASPPARPPRILFVGSETVANLDGLRWFRRRVLPLVQRLVPSSRLRIVGEAGRFIEPGPDVERVGWVDDLDLEYRQAALVVLPLRLGGRARRRVVEALAHHKALALTPAAAHGVDLEHRLDAIVAESEEQLAQGVSDVLRHDPLRERLEERAAEIARRRFSPTSGWDVVLRACVGAERLEAQSTEPAPTGAGTHDRDAVSAEGPEAPAAAPRPGRTLPLLDAARSPDEARSLDEAR